MGDVLVAALCGLVGLPVGFAVGIFGTDHGWSVRRMTATSLAVSVLLALALYAALAGGAP